MDKFPDNHNVTAMPDVTNGVDSTAGGEKSTRLPLGKRLIATAAIYGTAGAVVFGAYNQLNDDGPEPNYLSKELQETTSPEGVRAAFEQALQNDTCDTKVTPSEAANMYKDLFGPSSLNVLYGDHTRESYKVLDALRSARNGTLFTPISDEQRDEYDLLKNSVAYNHPGETLFPIERYERLVQEIAAENDIEAEIIGLDDSELSVATDMKDIQPTELAVSTAARANLLYVVEGIAGTPTSILKASGIKKIALGDIKKDNTAGLAQNDHPEIALEITGDNAPKLVGPDKDNHTFPHELYHKYSPSVCGGGDDVAYRALGGPDLHYGDDAEHQFEEAEKKGNYVRLGKQGERGDALIAVAYPYGATELCEDKATLMGENVFNAEKIQELYTTSADTAVLKKKIALELARMDKDDFAAANYYKALIRASEFAVQLQKQVDAARERLTSWERDNPVPLNGLPELHYGPGTVHNTLLREYQSLRSVHMNLTNEIAHDGISKVSMPLGG